MKRAAVTATGLMYLIWKFSSQGGNFIGTPGELFG